MAEQKTQLYPTGNSHTTLEFPNHWKVLDVGSGHNPHKRANVLVDRFILNNFERSGQKIDMPEDKLLIQADGAALPFPSKIFDFVICSHVVEHIPIDELEAFCEELSRVAKAGYIETPSKWAEKLRHAPNHRWFVSSKNNVLIFEPISDDYPLGWFGKLFFSIYFYHNIQAEGRDVFDFALGVNKPWHYLFMIIRLSLIKLWLCAKPLTYTRFRWDGNFHCKIRGISKE